MPTEPDRVWRDDQDSQDRVRAVATVLTRPRSASWVAEQAQVDYKTARKYLGKLVEDGRLLATQRGQESRYHPNPREQFFRELGDLVDEHSKPELTAELNAMGRRIEEWQEAYGVEDPDELRTTLDETLDVEERRARERVVDDWEYTRETRTLVRHAIRLYDDLDRLSATHSPNSPGVGVTSRE